MNGNQIRKFLEENGFSIFSVRKTKRMIGGQRYNFHGGLRQGNHPGTPYYFYQIELLSDGQTDVQYPLALELLEQAGFKPTYKWHEGLRIPHMEV